MSEENKPFLNIPPAVFTNEALEAAEKAFPVGAIVYLLRTKQFGEVEEVRDSADGPRLRIAHIGAVPVEELRLATEEEITSSKFSK